MREPIPPPPRCQGLRNGKQCRVKTFDIRLVTFYGDQECHDAYVRGEADTVRVWLCKLCRQGRK